MRSSKLLLAILVLLPLILLAGCGGGGGGGPAIPIVVAVTVTPANPTISTNQIVQFTATATYSNNTTVDVTASATWTSSAPAVATVSDASGSKGSASGVSAGTTTITASVGGKSGSTTLQVTGSGGTVGTNVMTVSVNGSLCSPFTSANYFNKPCVSVTVCVPGTSTCTTINDLLLDTGSYGLRIFKSALPGMALPQVASGSGSLVGCVQFADGSSLWGPIQRATVILGNEQGVTIPIQVIDSTFAPSDGTQCAVQSFSPYVGPDRTPTEAGFTGILGVGLFQQDCGTKCVNSALNGMYYSCTGTGCGGASVPLTDQVANPVAALPQDNNGVIVQLPNVNPGGVPSLTGSMILGIDTQADNAPGSAQIFATNSVGDFTTIFNNGTTDVSFNDSFLDTGSNANFIPNVAPTILPPCSGSNAEWYCPPITRSLFATVTGAGGSPSTPVAFTVSNALTLFGTSNNVFSDIAGTSTFGFDWGMPFHMGKKVLYGYEGRRTPSLNATGPFVGF